MDRIRLNASEWMVFSEWRKEVVFADKRTWEVIVR